MPEIGQLSKAEIRRVEALVALYREHEGMLKKFLAQILPLLLDANTILIPNVHSIKWRLKGEERLRDKLVRKMIETKTSGKAFDITPQNFFVKINDLVGVRILHLHTRQMADIHSALIHELTEARLNIKEGPFARTWDDETRTYFEEIGIKVRRSGPSMYTSVHYVIDSISRTRYTAEIQVRTLAEELWGEVAHSIDYPIPCADIGCREQIRVLARVASSCTRLVDSIFRSHKEYSARSERNTKRKK